MELFWTSQMKLMLGICQILLFFNFSLCLFACSVFSQLKVKRKTKKNKAVEEILFI